MIKYYYVLFIVYAVGQAIEGCNDVLPLGMANGFIQANQITASSSYYPQHRPERARLYSNTAWCAGLSDSAPYIEVDFLKIKKINGFAFQGDRSYKNYYPTKVHVMAMSDNGNYYDIKREGFVQVGSDDADNTTYYFEVPTTTQKIQIKPEFPENTVFKCLRVEFYGCFEGVYPLPLGMQNKIIPDNQITAYPVSLLAPSSTRLFADSFYQDNLYSPDHYLQIELNSISRITGFSIQGSEYFYVEKFWLSYSTNSVNYYDYNNKQEFNGNSINNQGVLYTPITSTLQAKILRIHLKQCSQFCALQFEIYGQSIDSNSDLKDIMTFTPNDNGYIGTNRILCTGLGRDFSITLKEYSFVSGILMEGSPNNDYWTKRYNMSYLTNENQWISYNKNFVGNNGRFVPLSVNWLSGLVVTKNVKITPTECHSKIQNFCCARIGLRGSLLSAPVNITWSYSGGIYITQWKETTSFPSNSNAGYMIYMSTSKPYPDSSFNPISRTITSLVTASSNVAAFYIEEYGVVIKISITTKVQNIQLSSKTETFYIQPKDPIAPEILESTTLDSSSKAYVKTFKTVSNKNGPISQYQIIASSKQFQSFNGLELLNWNEAQVKELPYYIAATINSNAFSGNQYSFELIEGETSVVGMDGFFQTIGNYYFYVRAVIKAENIVQFNFTSKTYYGQITSFQEVVRSTVKKLPPIKQTNNEVGLNITKGPNNTLYYQIVAMKYNKDLTSKYPSEYAEEEIKEIPSNNYNEPYIVAMFSADNYEKYAYFMLGDGKSYSYNYEELSTTRKRRAIQTYVNEKLKNGTRYVVFQRINAGGQFYNSPWSNDIMFRYQKPKSPLKTEEESTNTSLIGGVIGAAIACLILVIVIIYFLCIKKKNTDKSSEKSVEMSSVVVNNNNISSESKQDKIDAQPKKTTKSSSSNAPIPMTEYPEFYQKHQNNPKSDIAKEFQSVTPEASHPSTEAMKPINKKKNRYMNIIAYDHTRVKLVKLSGNEDSDYINGNFITDYYGEKKYIASQAPKNETIYDFWRMILTTKSSAIIMLTDFLENGKNKCAKYWSDDKEMNYGGITVSVYGIQTFADYELRNFDIRFGEETHTCLHFHFTSWPDHGCPEYPTMLLRFIDRFRQLVPYKSLEPCVVHCSAGVGRTGTLIIIDTMLELLRRDQTIDIFNYFKRIRSERSHMVQTFDQYYFVYAALYEVVCCGNTDIQSSIFPQQFQSLLSTDTNKYTFLENEFERLQHVTVHLDESLTQCARQKENIQRNRNQSILARDIDRVILPNIPGHTDYINAVFVDGYKNKSGIIVTEMPNVETVNDIWRVICEYNVTTVVNLTVPQEEKYPDVFPTTSTQFDQITVDVKSTSLMENNIQIINYKTKLDNNKQACTLLNYFDWPDHGVTSCDYVIQLLDEVVKSQQVNGDGVLLIVCSDGSNRSGTFVSCMNSLDQLKIEQNVDIFQSIRRIRLVRPEFVENYHQYRFIYEVINRYIETFSTYSNFS